MEASQTKIVNDFAAFFPDLAVRAEWFLRFLQESKREETETLRPKLLLALSKGFARAAKFGRKMRLAPGRLTAAKNFRSREVMPDLQQWEKELDRRNALHDAEWRAEAGRQAASKVDDLIEKYTALKDCRRDSLNFCAKPTLRSLQVDFGESL